MADVVESEKTDNIEETLKRDFTEDLQAHDDAIVEYDAYEAMSIGKTYDAQSRKTKNGLTDSATATIYLERAARVAGQLPDGEVIAFGEKDKGKGLLMDLLRMKWIYPNANAQRAFRTKMFMWQYGSSEYGWMPMYYDLNVSPSGYIGPDCWLWNPRNFIPQNGFTTITDMDYCHALAYKSPSYLQDLLDEDEDGGWDKQAIRDGLEQYKQALRQQDEKRDTLNAREKHAQSMRQICIATRYENGKDGRWISFLPDYGCKVIRNIKNPHKNGRIPFVIKPCIPTFDSFYNVGDFQRSKPMQFANDGLDNLYFEGIKINLFPPTVVNAQGVIKHTIKQEPGAIWMETQPNSARRLETSTAGLSTYQAAKGMAQGAIQSIAGTTDTRANAESSMNPAFGKTPEALRKISEREGTRDNQDRQFLEEAMKELIDGMLSLIPNMQTEDIPIDLFSTEIEDIIAAGYEDVQEILKIGGAKTTVSESGQTMRVLIDPKKLKGLEYRFELEPNSTSKKTKDEQKQSLVEFLGFIGQLPNALQQYQETTGKVPDWERIFTIYGKLSDVPGLDEIFVKAPMQPQEQPQQQEEMDEETQVLPEDQMMPEEQPAPQMANVAGMDFADPELAEQAAQLDAMRWVIAS